MDTSASGDTSASDNITCIIAIKALRDNYIWTILSKNSNQCVVVDPGEATPVLDYLQAHDLSLRAIMLTHHHWDHTAGVLELVKRFPNIWVFGPAQEPVAGMTHPVDEGDEMNIPDLGLHFKVIHIPGHTLGHIAFIGLGAVFSGDTLFTGGCGKIFEGTAEQMSASLAKLARLPDETLVYCGHEYTELNLRFAAAVEPDNPDIKSRRRHVAELRRKNEPSVPATLAIEKKTNPFLRTQEKSVINAAANYAKHPPKSKIDVLHIIRDWKNKEY